MQRNRNWAILDCLTEGESFTTAPCTPSRKNKLTGEKPTEWPDYSTTDWTYYAPTISNAGRGTSVPFEDIFEGVLGGASEPTYTYELPQFTGVR